MSQSMVFGQAQRNLSMDLSRKIERCPFCNSSDLTVISRFLVHRVSCNTCKSNGPRDKTLERAISNWNAISNRMHENRQKESNELMGRITSLENFVERMALDLYDNPS